MKVPLTIRDHVERAALVYGDRIGIVDEPDQVAPPLEPLTYSAVLERATALAAGIESLGVPDTHASASPSPRKLLRRAIAEFW